jgi:hypothetical protein
MSSTTPTVCAARRAQAARLRLAPGRETTIECGTCGAARLEECTPLREPAPLHEDLERVESVDQPEGLRVLLAGFEAQGVPTGTLRRVDEAGEDEGRCAILPQPRAPLATLPSAPISGVRAPCSCPDLAPADQPCALCLAREGVIELAHDADGPDLDAFEAVIASIRPNFPHLAIALERVDVLAFTAERVELGARGAASAACVVPRAL